MKISPSHTGQLNLAIPPWIGTMSIVACGLWDEGLVWLVGAVVCLQVAPMGSNYCSLWQTKHGCIMHDVIICSYQSAATSEIVKQASK